jgi:CheY-like chemotaxis protein
MLSGIEVLSEIRAIPSVRRIPILILSNSENPDDIRTFYALGSNCFMRKPGNLDEFIQVLRICYVFWSKAATLQPPLR